VPVLVKVAEAVGYAHAHGVVHRDLKPSNVVLGDFGEVTVIDWGIAKVEDASLLGIADSLPASPDGDGKKTQAGALLGTPAYMSPEQATGRNDDVGPGADVFALGAMLYEILSGRPPYAGPTAMAVLSAAIEARPDPITRAAPDAPSALRDICTRAMAIDAAVRPRSARELAEALERALTDALRPRESNVARATIAGLTLLAIIAAVLGGTLVAARLPALEDLGFGRYPIFFWGGLALACTLTDLVTRGRYALDRTSLVFVLMTMGSGPFSGLMGMLSILHQAQAPSIVSDGRAWRALLTAGTHDVIACAILGPALGGFLLIAWEVVRRAVPDGKTTKPTSPSGGWRGAA